MSDAGGIVISDDGGSHQYDMYRMHHIPAIPLIRQCAHDDLSGRMPSEAEEKARAKYLKIKSRQ